MTINSSVDRHYILTRRKRLAERFFILNKSCPLKTINTTDAQNTKQMCQDYHKKSWHVSFFTELFQGMHQLEDVYGYH